MDKLRTLRKQRGMTAKELANLVGVSEVSITQYENGNRSPRRKVLESLAEALDTSVDYLLGKEEDPIHIDMDRVDKQLLKELQDITPSEKQMTLAFIAGLKANRAE